MRLYAPKYYEKFNCIAGRCERSCCIGWEIDIDADTAAKYGALRDGYGAMIAGSISNEGTPHFKLCEGDRCPHLDEHGLCRIITNLGEEYLCDICREHPRFYNYTYIAEVGLGMSCPEAARIILSSEDFRETVELGSVDTVADDIEFDGIKERGDVYSILCEADGYETSLREIYHRYSIDAGDDEYWLGVLEGLEYLEPAHKKLFLNYSSALRPSGKDEYLKRFLAYFIYRHCTEAFDVDDFRLRLSFCLFCERLFASLICSEEIDSFYDIAALASVISEEIEYSDENTLALTYGQ